MGKRFSASNVPLLAGVVKEGTPKDALEKIRYFEEKGATAIDLHLSCLDDEYKTVDAIKQIAKRYGLTEANVKKILSRTREKLRAYLEKEGWTI